MVLENIEEMNKENISNTNDEDIESKRKNNDDDSIAKKRTRRETPTIVRLGISSEYDANDDSFFENIQQTQLIVISRENDEEMTEKNGNQITISPNGESANENNSEKAANGDPQTGSEHQNESTCENHSDLMMLSPAEKILYLKMIDLMAELKVIQKGITELQVASKITKQNDTTLKRLKRDQLVELGLPLENETQMENFESKLKVDDFYRKTVCSLLAIILYFSLLKCTSFSIKSHCLNLF